MALQACLSNTPTVHTPAGLVTTQYFDGSLNPEAASLVLPEEVTLWYCPICDECQTQSAIVWPLPKPAHQDDSNDTPQPICEFQVSFLLLRIRTNQDKA